MRVGTGNDEMTRRRFSPRIRELPYHRDSSLLFAPLSASPWAVFIDSGRPGSTQGRFDILSADPSTVLITHGERTEIRGPGQTRVSTEDPFRLVQEALAPGAGSLSGLPFCGGAIGYFGYDLGRRLERLPAQAEDAEQLPEMAVGIYDWALVVDHQERRSWLVGQGRDPRTRRRWDDLAETFSRPSGVLASAPLRVTGPVRSNFDAAGYGAAFARIKEYLRAGDCYQVNLAQRFAAPAEGDAFSAYRLLREWNPAPFAAYLNLPFAQVLSASPERFLRVEQGRVETRPIKGTRPRSAHLVEDRRLARELCRSSKDRAENLMIVDLLRNDIGKTCRIGSVRVPRLFELESFATVHHLVSTITGDLKPGASALDLLRGCFPGGSITGAPKLRAMEIIEELEPHRRGVYCGAIGYVGFDGAMDTNIAIRTLVYSDGVIRGYAGGGIVLDSEAQAEYQETFDKAASLMRVLESLQSPGGRSGHVGR